MCAADRKIGIELVEPQFVAFTGGIKQLRNIKRLILVRRSLGSIIGMDTIVKAKIRVGEQSRCNHLGACIVNVVALDNYPEIIFQK